MSSDVVVPPLGESITHARLIAWHKPDGAAIGVDEPLCELETDKANVELTARAAGVLRRLKQEGDTVKVDEVIARIEEGEAPPAASGDAAQRAAAPVLPPADVPPTPATPNPPAVEMPTTPAAPAAATTPPGETAAAAAVATAPQTVSVPPPAAGVRRVPMSKIRKRIAERLVQAQNTAAILTTFNEIDLSRIIDLRTRHRERFEQMHGVGLGYMAFFARAVVLALREIPALNAFLEGDDIVYHDYVHLGIAVSTDRGLAVPVLRNAQDMTLPVIEREIQRLAAAVREGRLAPEELSGGTFSITNGGVFGSLLSTPILNPPQSGILGMHNIQKRPVAIDDRVEIRPMMYVALSYDHRVVDGREAITFLVRVKQYLEDPARMMLEI